MYVVEGWMHKDDFIVCLCVCSLLHVFVEWIFFIRGIYRRNTANLENMLVSSGGMQGGSVYFGHSRPLYHAVLSWQEVWGSGCQLMG